MTTKIIELQIDIPDNIQPPPTDLWLCNWIIFHLKDVTINNIKLPPIETIKVKQTMPSYAR